MFFVRFGVGDEKHLFCLCLWVFMLAFFLACLLLHHLLQVRYYLVEKKRNEKKRKKKHFYFFFVLVGDEKMPFFIWVMMPSCLVALFPTCLVAYTGDSQPETPVHLVDSITIATGDSGRLGTALPRRRRILPRCLQEANVRRGSGSRR